MWVNPENRMLDSTLGTNSDNDNDDNNLESINKNQTRQHMHLLIPRIASG